MAVTGPSRCPGCTEPLEPGDNFCGVCGADVSAAVPDGTAAGAYGAAGAFGAAPPPAPESRLPDGSDSSRGSGGEAGADSPAPVADGSDGAAPVADGPDGATARADGPADPRESFAAKTCVACRTGTVDQDGYCEHCGHAQPRERDHFERELERVAAVSDRGHRHHRNEDFFTVAHTALSDGSPAVLAVVCDGVSSATRPDEASQAAAETAAESLLAALPREAHPQQAMHDAILAAAKSVDALAEEPEHPRDPYRQQNAPACTLVAAVAAAGVLTVGWVGDSRAYWIPDDRTAPGARLTEDDSWAAQMVANNLMSEAEAYSDERAHAITGWLGADAYELQPHTAAFRPDRPGVVVVCTDGLWNYTEAAAELAALLPPDAGERPLHSARTLVRHALDSGGHDNVTVAVVPFPVPVAGAVSA
ncbi:protein phosphatase 2C domain-containing protein [Streptomyces ochraceiscleroticus]|uniref:Protein phosphatase 2C domain-containing protein n=1 Tax=Streptomyces ochraceiscleroticus TaxID=47761 RepID=A0ABW1MDE1_9ACTN|nr:protein phosphatase 2C domain-containing protein [Streptomyces ochraceiscleroticus]